MLFDLQRIYSFIHSLSLYATIRRWTWPSPKQFAYRPGFYPKVSRRALMSRGVTGKWPAYRSGPKSPPLE